MCVMSCGIMDAGFNVVHVTMELGLVREPQNPKKGTTKGMMLSRETRKGPPRGCVCSWSVDGGKRPGNHQTEVVPVTCGYGTWEHSQHVTCFGKEGGQ